MTARRRIAATLVASVVALAAPATAGEVRVITAPGLPVLPRLDRPPERIEPPPKPVKPSAPIVERRMAPVTVADTATLTHARLTLRLVGVVPLARDETCGEGDAAWNCGRRLLAAMRGFVRLRPVVCLLPSDARLGEHPTRCTLGDVDLADRAVRAGWARAEAGGPHGAAEDEARRERRGLWGDAPPPPIAEPPPTTAAPVGADGIPPDPTLAPLAGAQAK